MDSSENLSSRQRDNFVVVIDLGLVELARLTHSLAARQTRTLRLESLDAQRNHELYMYVGLQGKSQFQRPPPAIAGGFSNAETT